MSSKMIIEITEENKYSSNNSCSCTIGEENVVISSFINGKSSEITISKEMAIKLFTKSLVFLND